MQSPGATTVQSFVFTFCNQWHEMQIGGTLYFGLSRVFRQFSAPADF